MLSNSDSLSAKSVLVAPNPIEFAFCWKRFAPIFEVKITTQLRKLTVRPFPSVSCPSSKICNNMLCTSLCAFSISSKRTIECGRRRTFSVNSPPSSCPIYPAVDPTRRLPVCGWLNSDISIFINDFSSL